MIRWRDGQPDSVVIAEGLSSIQLTGPMLRDDDDHTLIVHEDGLGWRVPEDEFIWSDLTIEDD
jgi:hypothetical protein